MEKEEKKEKTLSLIDQATLVAERIEAANKVAAELLNKQEQIKVRQIMGGDTKAGEKPIEKTKEERQVESARAMLAGTGYDKMLFPVKEENKNGK